jgi:hypothetical protein
MTNRAFKIFVFFLIFGQNSFAQDGKFTFSLPTPLTTSAGVFKNDSILVKTLWNIEKLGAGTYTRYWDGTNVYGNAISSPAASYKIKILSNNVNYTWQGTIGNNSDMMTGPTKHRGYSNCMTGLSFGPNYGYFSTGCSEDLLLLESLTLRPLIQKFHFFRLKVSQEISIIPQLMVSMFTGG